MARKTFISYKYSEAKGIRDDILKALGKDASFYQGETSDSPDLTDTTTENIKSNLRNMMYGTSVTIVIISPNMKQSRWIDWEIEYSLREYTREERTSRTNGILGVIMKYNNGYNWIANEVLGADGCTYRTIENSWLYPIIINNRFNLRPLKYACQHCHTVDRLSGSYFSLIEQDIFLRDPQSFIENAFEKSENVDNYNIEKSR